jgi:hypothetical protein
MRVRNVGRIMIAKGLELDRDIYAGEMTQVKPGFEQSERILAMINSKAVDVVDLVNIKVGTSTVAAQPGAVDPFSEFGKEMPLPKRVVEQQKASERYAAEQEAEVKKTEIRPEGVEDVEAITSQLLSQAEKTTVLEDPKAKETADELTEFLRRNGGARMKFIEEMNDVQALKIIAESAKTDRTKQAAEARLKMLIG